MKNNKFIIILVIITLFIFNFSSGFANPHQEKTSLIRPTQFNPKKRVELVTRGEIFEGREALFRDEILKNGLQNYLLIGEKGDFSKKLNHDDYELFHSEAAACGAKSCGVWVSWELFRKDGVPVLSGNRYYPIDLAPKVGRDRNIWRKVPGNIFKIAGFDIIASVRGKPLFPLPKDGLTQVTAQPITKTNRTTSGEHSEKKKILFFTESVKGASPETSQKLNDVLAHSLTQSAGAFQYLPVRYKKNAYYVIQGSLEGVKLKNDLVGVTLTRNILNRKKALIGGFKIETAEKREILLKKGINADTAAAVSAEKMIAIIEKDQAKQK